MRRSCTLPNARGLWTNDSIRLGKCPNNPAAEDIDILGDYIVFSLTCLPAFNMCEGGAMPESSHGFIYVPKGNLKILSSYLSYIQGLKLGRHAWRLTMCGLKLQLF